MVSWLDTWGPSGNPYEGGPECNGGSSGSGSGSGGSGSGSGGSGSGSGSGGGTVVVYQGVGTKSVLLSWSSFLAVGSLVVLLVL